jgi:thioester reductase-like protein
MGNCVLLTGATGFLGKVVLTELLRRRGELGIEKVVLLVRERAGESAESRTRRTICASVAFSTLPPGWQGALAIVPGELSRPECGLSPGDHARVLDEVTHVIHCAASIEFDLPIDQACAANVTSALNVLALAGACKRLERMVSVSTAYVTRHRPGVIGEVLGPLPQPAESLYQDILAGRADERALLERAGHANTYTLTKCLAEHLLMQRRGDLPLTIVRPSIISASWRYPFPGWIDSKAALAAFVTAIGAGYMRVILAAPTTRLDVVPCDEVAGHILAEAFARAGKRDACIVHSVAGRAKSITVAEAVETIVESFRLHPVARTPQVAYVGPRGWRYRAHTWLRHRAPAKLGELRCLLHGDARGRRRIRRGVAKLEQVNALFVYFTHHSFDFATSRPLPDELDPADYLRGVCNGLYRHVMRRDAKRAQTGAPSEVPRHSAVWRMRPDMS